MNILIIIFSIIFAIYFLQILFFVIGFKKIKTFENISCPLKLENKKYLSVIIPFKNEEDTFKKLITGLSKQSLSSVFFEIIFVNDGSVDNSEKILSPFINKNHNWKLLNTGKLISGKKNAIKMGISEAAADIIITTDADCVHNKKWLETILNFYIEYKPKMIIAPVLMKGKSFFQKMQSLEFFSLIASTAGAVGIKHPVMCNGANLIYEKKVYYEFDNALKFEEVSGDDVFLMHNIKRKYRNEIKYLKSKNAIVYTEAEKSVKSFFTQRFRWASKSKSYSDFDTILSSLIVLFANIVLAILISYLFFNSSVLLLTGIFFGIKFFIDFVFLFYAGIFFKQIKLMLIFPFLSLIYPFYIVFTVFGSMFFKTNRKI